MELHVVSEDSDHVIAWAPGLLVSSWGGRVTSPRIDALDRCIPEMLAQTPDGRYAAISVIEPTVSMRFEEEARELSAQLQRRWAEQTYVHAYLVEGSGFLPATVRTLTAGLHLVNRAPYPLKVFGDPLALAEWVAEHGPLDARAVRDAVLDVRLSA